MKDKDGIEIKPGDEVNLLVRATYRSDFTYDLPGVNANAFLQADDGRAIIEVTRIAPPLKPGQIYRAPYGALFLVGGDESLILIRTNEGHPRTIPQNRSLMVMASWELVVDVP